ncbi:unnamed protein product [Closterium sp. Yama58-4]|nr:unnamed protein product [Closterium sp. Yama58-4]
MDGGRWVFTFIPTAVELLLVCALRSLLSTHQSLQPSSFAFLSPTPVPYPPVFTFIPTAVELLLVCALLANHISLSFAGVVLLTFVVYVAWTVALTKASVSIRKEVNRLDGLATGKVVDVLLNHETVVQFNNQRLDLMHYDSLLRDYQRESVNLEKVSAALNGGQTTIISIGLAAVMAMAGLRVAVGRMTVGDLVLVNGLILQLSLPLQFLGFLYRDLRQSLVDMEAMFHMLSLESDLKDGHLELAPRAEGVAVDVNNISFSYMNGRQVLKGVSFSIAPGESVAIVGPSGSGKSTIVKLLLRLYDPSEGSISFDGTDARELKQESLRQAVAVVPQDTVLFNDSIRYNIAYGRPSASVAEVDRAAGQAKLLDAIRRMPDGFDTVVGERGLKLSGGEKQRVAIARAFLKNPRLLVCDEATSALDSATEANILRSLQQLAAGRSCLFVAHRLSTIKHCDKILVMEAGRVVEQGTHEQLLAAGGKYAAIVMVAAKFLGSAYFNNACFATVGGIGTNEINKLELDFLFRINFTLNVTAEEFNKYKMHIEDELDVSTSFSQDHFIRGSTKLMKQAEQTSDSSLCSSRSRAKMSKRSESKTIMPDTYLYAV